MNLFARSFCRVYQTCFYLAMPLLPYREPQRYREISDIRIIFENLKIKSALLVTDKFLKESGAVAKLERVAEECGVSLTVYDSVKPNPTFANAKDAKAAYIRGNCQCIIAFGGGSSMDCAKAAGALVAYPKKDLNQLKGLLRVLRRLPAIIAIPTTAGTGSEVTPTAVVTDDKTHHKYTMNSFPLIPHYAILDPEVTFTLPKSLTSTTGMDALTHAVEAYIGNSTTKETREYALKAVKLIFDNIKTVYENPTDKVARENMLYASYIAGIAFSKSYVGYIHAVAHSLGGRYDIPHGLANTVIMPIVLRYYGKTVHKKLKQLAVAAGVASISESEAVASEKFIKAIEELNDYMEIPTGFKEIKEADIPLMAKHASREANPLYPVPLIMNAKELEVFYRKLM